MYSYPGKVLSLAIFIKKVKELEFEILERIYQCARVSAWPLSTKFSTITQIQSNIRVYPVLIINHWLKVLLY